ncbi:putative cell number regulator [Heterostelium album PN500]|uniref:Putative cell number regulator n=1 Tax=Heterostelium pallidum (strain ATCC 26659 / Pp 5 / PN500) TaxID=670386 RepID=D3BFU5_HETP5|nr:putative cell number regulator [Heterostelium album PN500]EFA79705.1 putative cell number regulator [Heterostelium album PN500]|eukprot:XP_020431826.1 putative cell number regulator [Heterostelium album PN500]
MMKRPKVSFLSSRKILLFCLVAVIATTFISMRMITTNVNIQNTVGTNNKNEDGLGDPIDVTTPSDREYDNTDNSNSNTNSKDIHITKKKEANDSPNFFNKYELPFRSQPKPMTEQEQYEANRLKALRSKANDEERPILLKMVFDEYEREAKMLQAMPVPDRPDCVALPPASALVDYVKPDPVEDKKLMFETTWKPGQLTPRQDGLNPYSYMTMLREPVDRVISHYYYHRQNKRDPGHQLAMRNTFKEWLEKSPAANNEQARMLCGVAPYDYPGVENTTEACAIHHLQYTYKFVGITEKFSESLVLLTHYGGFQAIRFTKINSGTQRVTVNEVPEDIIKEIIQRNQADIFLYEQAKIIFEKQIDAIGRSFIEAETKEFKKKVKIF